MIDEEEDAMDPDDASAASEQPADDLRAIRGIGRETARRLHEAGVRTFADLARHSPSEIATKARVQAPRVEREDWIGHARELAELPSPADAEGPEIASDDAEHRESFVLRLTLDDDNKVIRTVVTHVRSEREAPSWAGWATARLLEFLSEYVDLGEEAAARPAAAAATAGEPEPARPPIAAAGEPEPALPTPPLPSEVRLRELEVIPAASSAPQWSLEAGEPFTVRLAFDLQGAEAVSRAPLAYAVTIVARTMGESRRQTETVGENDGTLGGRGGAAVEVQSTGLPPGIYRLEGALRLREPESARPRLVTLEGGLLQVD
jgi:Helix-hairpin-helix domain